LSYVTGDQHSVPVTQSYDASVTEPSVTKGNTIAPNYEVNYGQ